MLKFSGFFLVPQSSTKFSPAPVLRRALLGTTNGLSAKRMTDDKLKDIDMTYWTETAKLSIMIYIQIQRAKQDPDFKTFLINNRPAILEDT